MAVDLGPINSATYQVQVYDRLREALFTGMFAPGEAMTIRGLAAMLGTSPMPVREALQRLVAEHALMQMPNRTFRVTPFSSEMFRELVRVRMTVEGLAAAEAARRATTKQLQQLSRLNEQMIQAIEAGEPSKVLTVNREFHFALYEISHMPQLLDIINGLWLRVGPYLMHAHRSLEDPRTFFRTGTQFHERLIQSCANRQPKKAARAIAGDIWYSARYFRRDVDLVNSQGPGNTQA